VSQSGLGRYDRKTLLLGTSARLKPLAVSPRAAGRMIGLGMSRIYELMREGELISFRSGKSRRVTVQSIHAYVERRLAESAGEWQPFVEQPPMLGRQQHTKSKITDSQELDTR
jgi:hypothetical protein